MQIVDLVTPKEAADILKISKSTITRCMKNGAPVHRWGSSGRLYRINVDEFIAWMEEQRDTGMPKHRPPQKATAADWEAKRIDAMRKMHGAERN